MNYYFDGKASFIHHLKEAAKEWKDWHKFAIESLDMPNFKNLVYLYLPAHYAEGLYFVQLVMGEDKSEIVKLALHR